MSINPNIKNKRGAFKNVTYYVDGIKSRNRFVLGEAITLIESTDIGKRNLGLEILNACGPAPVNTTRIGITGSPGVGKSTFLDTMGTYLTEEGHRVAVLAIDPSSIRTKGSILGDKTRMEKLSTNDRAFIRPTSTGTYLGGIALATKECILLCEHAGFDIVFVETVGVGQSEVQVASVVDLFLLMILPGSGDDIQGIKRGIMEMADLLVINKADGERKVLAEQSKRNYEMAIRLLHAKIEGWNPRIEMCSALHHEGIDKVWSAAKSFMEVSRSSGFFTDQRHRQDLEWFEKKYRSLILESFFLRNKNRSFMLELKDKITNQRITPIEAILTLYQTINPE